MRALPARLAAVFVAVGAGCAIAAILPAAPALAHGAETKVAVTTASAGSALTVEAVVTYPDKHTAERAVLATSAVAPDGTQERVTMVETPDPGRYTGTVRLPAGSYQVFVNVSGTAPGAGMTTVLVQPEAAPAAGRSMGVPVALVALAVAGSILMLLARRRVLQREA